MRIFNFSAGPAVLPEEVLLRAQKELVIYGNDGMSVMEMSHRTPMYEKIIFSARDNLKKLMKIGDDYEVLFLQGGASLQFAMVPMNLMHSGKADYVVSGMFAKKAMQEGKKYGSVRNIADSSDENFSYVPKISLDMIDKNADFVHMTTNNTIYGTSFRTNIPDTGNVPLVADMSSNILSEEYDISKFGLIYAGAQKNIGPAGVTIVIIRKDLIKEPIAPYVPSMMSYKIMAENDSMYNTPPTYGIYIAGLVFEHLLDMGGVPAMQKQNEDKAQMLYDAIDSSKRFTATARKDSRSIMNVTFVTGDEALDKAFVSLCKQKGLANIKGHRSVGGMRASIYNAMPVAGVEALCHAIEEFDKNN